MVYTKPITFCGQPATLACDGNCRKAWGIENRPKVMLTEDEDGGGDDYAFLADGELGDAPDDPGTYEGGDGKPDAQGSEAMNRWCARQCERSELVKPGQRVKLHDFSRRLYNVPSSDPEATPAQEPEQGQGAT